MEPKIVLSFKERIAVFFINHGPHKWKWVQLANRNVEQKKMAAFYEAARKEKQDRCSHLKGGSRGNVGLDFAVGRHTFIDGHIEVKCLVCSKQFDPRGKEAQFMLKRTSNTPSSSEVSLAKPKDQKYPWGGSDTSSDNRTWSSPGAAITKKIIDMYRLGISSRTQRVQRKDSHERKIRRLLKEF